MQQFTVAGENGAYVKIEVEGYEESPHPSGVVGSDWLTCAVIAKFSGFQSSIPINCLTSDIEYFHGQLRELLSLKAKEAAFQNIEENLSLFLKLEKTGRVRVTGQINNGLGSSLSFSLDSDLTYLEQADRDLQAVIRAFPSRKA